MQTLLLDMQLAAGTVALMIVLVVYQIYRIRWLRSHGKRVVAVVTSIRQQTGKTAQGFSRENYYLTAIWTSPRTGQTYTFWTWIMNSRPAYTKGSLVPVLIDPTNPRRYSWEF
jgi:hypothetical protein